MCLSCVLLVGLGSPCEAQAPTVPLDPAGQQQPPHQDAPAPEPHPDLEPLVEVIRTRLHERKYEEALQQAGALLQRATEKGDAVGQAYAQRFRARALQELNRLQEALLAWERAEQLWREIGDGALVVEAMLGQAFCVWRANEAGSRRLVEQALELARAERRRPLTLARILGNAGADWYNARVLGFAQQCWERALVIFERLAPGSPETADTLNNLGIVAGDQGNLALARRYFEQALALHKRLAPNSLEVANTLNNLGVVAHRWGDLNLAQRYFEQALAIKVRLVPNSLTVASTLNNLGGVAFYRGDLALAQQYYERALAIQERLVPNSLTVASTLNNLGGVAFYRGDLLLAWRYFEQALALYERLAPNSLEVAGTLNNLGNVALNYGDLVSARQYYGRALAIQERLAPNSLTMASTHVCLGLAARDGGDLALAQRYFEQALALYERLAPNSLEVAGTLNNLGSVARHRGDVVLAQRSFERALAIQERLAPNSLTVASTLSNLAQLKLIQRQPQAALQLLQRAVALVEAHRQTLADPETRALLAEQRFQPYLLLALAYLQLNQPAKAAEAFERSRARSLAETLHQRQLALSPNLPAPLRQLLQQHQQLSAQRQRAYRQLQRADLNNPEQLAQLQRRLRALEQQQRALDERIRREFPAFARQYLPTPLSIQQIQQSLDAGTVLLYYALMENYLLIVAVSPTRVQGVVREVDSKQLEQQVRELRRILGKMPAFRSAPERGSWQRLSQQLYAQLVAPVQGMLKGARRVLLCPDGVLSQLPWAALIVERRGGQPVYWVERATLHLTPSVGVYRQARRVRPATQGVVIAAVWRYTGGAPIESAQARSSVATLLRRSGASTLLTDLPAVRMEVQLLRRLFGRQAGVVENAQATPQVVQRLAKNARVVHFACHARADNTDPLGSALLLAPAGAPRGMLTAEEVLFRWRLNADVVMLSACETGIGALRLHEGMYSLGRAFLGAGARSVGMSLWEVSDKATAELMHSFYKWYLRGVTKDEALRRAQLALRRSTLYADPYYWSGFVLMGDYR